MAKIINVDFKKKRIEFTWDEGTKKKNQEKTERLEKVFQAAMSEILELTKGDNKFHSYCSKTLGGIIYNLKER